MRDEIVSEQQPIPVFEVTFHHIHMVAADAQPVTFDEPGIERWLIIALGRPPDIVVAL
jgi:hypothetical protein